MITAVFLIVTMIIFNGIALVIPKNLNKIEMYGSTVFVLLFQLTTDVILGLKYNLYGYFREGIQLVSFLTFFGIYPAFAIVMLNYFPFDKKLINKIIYITGVSLFNLIFEWLSIKFKYFYHDEWTYLYSAILYPLLVSILVLNLKIIRKLTKNSK